MLRAANQPVPDELLKFGTVRDPLKQNAIDHQMRADTDRAEQTVKRKQHDAYGAFFRNTGDTDEPQKSTKITFDD